LAEEGQHRVKPSRATRRSSAALVQASVPGGAAAFTADELAAGEELFAREWSFVKGVVELAGLPDNAGDEIAFAGRSNVGKSSLINVLVRHKGLARTSNTPGRTQEINYFAGGGLPLSIVDLPGYGFASAPKTKVDTWTRLVKDYLRGRPNLARVYLLIDSRHGIKAVDQEIMGLLDEAAVSYQVVLTKIDKISASALAKVLETTLRAVAKMPAAYPLVLATSSEKNIGFDELRAAIAVLVAERG
jgi:GTP-binding protein